MKWSLEGGVAVITGAASGIGRALAQRLAREQMALALVDMDAEGLAGTVRLLDGAQSCFSTHVVNVADAQSMERLSKEVVDHHRRVTLLINNAGVALLGTFEEISIEEFDWLLQINFWGVIHGAKYFLPLLRREPRAHIVNVSSMFGLMATPGNSAYCASKFAVRGFTEALRHELEGSTINVSCVHPGRVQTAISRRARISEGIFNRSDFDENREGTDVGPTSPQEAANRIVEGIKRGEPRILIGPDAIWLDRLQRMFPVRAGRILSSLRKIRRKLGNRSGS